VNEAREKKLVLGHKLRCDTTVVESNIHYPTDASLLSDCVRVITRTVVIRQIILSKLRVFRHFYIMFLSPSG
jgi:hypothetical protein